MATLRTRSYDAAPASLRRRLFIAAAILVALLAAETAVLATSVRSLPNTISLPLFEQLPLLATLWASNPSAALSVTAQQALFIIEHRPPATGLQVWGLYYFPLTLAGHLLIAWVAATLVTRAAPHERWQRMALASGAALLALGVSYVRLASCCTVAPRWSLDILALAQALDPTSAGPDWQGLYAFIEPAFPGLQLAISLSGAMLLLASLRMRTASLPPAPRRHAN